MIEKRGNGYRVRVGRDMKWRTFKRWGDAEQYEAELKRARQRERAGMETLKEAITYGALCDLYEQNFSPSEWRKSMLRHSKERWGKVFVRSIEPEGVGRWLHGLDKAEKTKAHILETMRQVCRAGVEWGYLAKSPVRPGAFKAPSKHSREAPIKPFESWSAVLRVADACDGIDETGAIVRFIASTGLTSPSEWIDARWHDIDLDKREMIVHGTKTENRQRTIPLSETALAALRSLPTPLRQDQLVFPGKTGGWLDYREWRRTTWRLALASCDEAHRGPNELRHTFATLALQSGVPIDAVADILGHSDVAITYRYYRKWTKTMAHKARDILDTWSEEGEEDVRAAEDG